MRRVSSAALCALTVVGLALAGGCGGGGDGSPQTPVGIQITPASVSFGAIGSTRQLSAVVVDANGQAVAGAPAVVWSRAGSGATASVSGSGLVTALGVGATDSAVASASTFTAKAPISVTQVVASVTVSSTGSDTLRTTGRTKTYAAAAKDSNNNAIGSASFTWVSGTTNVATVNSGTGVATAASDGSATITATASGSSISGSKTLVVQRFATTFSLSPNTAQAITTNGGTLIFTGTAQDSAPTNLTVTWTSRNTAVITLSPASGTSPSTGTATATGNGSTYAVMSGGTRKDSAQVTVSNQTAPPPPMTAAVNVTDDAFTSVHNSTTNLAIDTVAAGGTVTWTWAQTVSVQHNVTSDNSAFTASATTAVRGTMFQVTFANAGTFQYHCTIHGSPGAGMAGTIVVR